MITRKRDYRELAREAFKGGGHFEVLVYTGKTDEEFLPVFRTMLAEGPEMVMFGGEVRWGLSCLDKATGESRWFDYRDCVSLEGWAVLDRFLRCRFGWVARESGLREEIRTMARAQLREGR